MTYQERLRILGFWTRLIADPTLARDHDCWAMLRPAANEIAVDPTVAAERQGESLIHEIIEALNARLEIGLTHDRLTALAAGLYAVLRDNPALMAFVIAGSPIVAPEPAGR